MPKQVSFKRAYSGWRLSGSTEEKELGEGRAFLRWLQRHELSIAWQPHDFELHPYFTQPNAPAHQAADEMAQGLCFALPTLQIGPRRVKLYLYDEDVLRLINMPYGRYGDFLALVTEYIDERQQWQLWQAPAPTFVDWLTSRGLRPLFASGQLGFQLPNR